MQAVATAELMPGCCVFCQSGQGPFVDTFRDDDDPRIVAGPDQVQFGNICHWYICARCVSSMMQLVAPALGQKVVQQASLDADTAQFQDVCDRLRVAEARVEELEDTLRVVSSLAAPAALEVDMLAAAHEAAVREAHPAGKGRAPRRRVGQQ